MGFITTYIAMGVFGYLSHYLYHKYGLKKGHTAWIAWYSIIVIVGLLTFDFLMYVGTFDSTLIPLFNSIPFSSNIENGRDFMWNSFQLIGIDFGIPFNVPGLNSIAVIMFFSYLPWYLYFKLLSRQMFGGNKRFEEGLIWFLGPTRKSKDEQISKPPE